MNSKLVMYDNECTFVYFEKTEDYFDYDRNYETIRHYYYFFSGLDNTGRYDMIELHIIEMNYVFYS